MAPEPVSEGAWVFLSHSHLDLEKVRRVRNALEAKGHNPLMFFLKCLDDDSGIDDLIRREIEARTWFLLCQSTNANASRWVQEEVRIIKGLEGKVYEEIDLDGDLESQVERVTALSRRATVFISYARSDTEAAQAIHEALVANDFDVGIDTDVAPMSDWEAKTNELIDAAIDRGFFLLLLSPEALQSVWVRHELEHALARQEEIGRRGSVIPILVEVVPYEELPPAVAESNWFDLTQGALDDRLSELVTLLKTIPIE
jgi:hypothetical protein